MPGPYDNYGVLDAGDGEATMASYYEEQGYGDEEPDEQERRKSLLSQGIWLTKEGEEIPVREMKDYHLLHSDRMLRRKGCISLRTLAAYLYGEGPNGEMAQLAFASEQDEVFKAPVSPYLDLFEGEINRQGLERLPT
jgi:hypothetical protein